MYYLCINFQKNINLLVNFIGLNIVAIYSPYIYSIQYDDKDDNEFDRLFDQWNDVSFVTKFMEDNQEYLKTDVWQRTPEPEDAARQVLDEAEALENLFDELNENTTDGRKPDFDSHFKYLEGKYKYELQWPPMKSYGTIRPSLLRMYAIKMGNNVYLITGGGIKLSDTIQNSPGLKDYVIQDIDRVRAFFRENGIMDNEDMEQE